MLNCHDIAHYFLSLADEEAGDTISNLKLQKLVYYAQGFHLALYKTPLFTDNIEAWNHGPVIPELYRIYKQYGSGPIPQPKELDFSIYNEEIKELLNEVYTVYGQYSAWKLRDLTHEESTWKNAYSIKKNGIISHQAMTDYFKTMLVN